MEAPVRNRGGPSEPRSGGRIAFAVVGALALSVALLVTPATAGPVTASGWSLVPISWNNGLVLCNFLSSQPGVAVSALSLAGTGLGIGASGMEEISPSGSVVASAPFSSQTWSPVNNSSGGWFDMFYSGQVPILPTGATTPVGTASARMDFILPSYAETPGQNLSAVNFTFSVSNWAWQHSGDSLRATISSWTSYPVSEEMHAGSAPGPILSAVSVATGQPLQYIIAPAFAVVTASSGAVSIVSAAPTVSLAGNNASVGVTFGNGSGSVRSLSYTSQVGIVLPRTLAGIPTYYVVVAGSAGIAATLSIAVTARRLRRAPSDLEFVEEEP